ncbi:hypothetical protein D9M71_646330 [compost metagenome]
MLESISRQSFKSARIDVLHFQLQLQQFKQVPFAICLVDALHQRCLSFALVRIGFPVGVQGTGQFAVNLANRLTDLGSLFFQALLACVFFTRFLLLCGVFSLLLFKNFLRNVFRGLHVDIIVQLNTEYVFQAEFE